MPVGINKIIFFIFLLITAFQDGRKKTIDVWMLITAGMAGVFLMLADGQHLGNRLLSCLIGFVIVFLSRVTDGAIGAGDGWFFAVSGLFLEFLINLELLVYGVFLSGFICGGVYFFCRLQGRDVRKVSVPFLPFLVPVWIGLVML